jgi:hypothetical protein
MLSDDVKLMFFKNVIAFIPQIYKCNYQINSYRHPEEEYIYFVTLFNISIVFIYIYRVYAYIYLYV